jgi:hypothetical protein
MLLIGDLVEMTIKSEFHDTVIFGEITGLRSDQFNPDNQFVLIGNVGHWFATNQAEIKKLASNG